MNEKSILKTLITYFILFTLPVFSQIRIQELPEQSLYKKSYLASENNDTRRVTNLNDNWFLAAELNSGDGIEVGLPFNFSGYERVVLTRELPETIFDPNYPNTELLIPSLVHSADILLNDVVIHRHPGGEFPISIPLDKTVLSAPGSKKLTIVLSNELDAVSTIPVKQRFLFPQNPGAITDGVYVIHKPEVFIADVHVTNKFSESLTNLEVIIKLLTQGKQENDTTALDDSDMRFTATLLLDGKTVASNTVNKSEYADSNSRESLIKLAVKKPALWSPVNPVVYTLRIDMYIGGKLIDTKVFKQGFYNLEIVKDKILLNGKSFRFNAVAYTPFSDEKRNLISEEQYRKDLELIKDAGFNTIKFSRKFPSVFFVELAAEYGLFCVPELELNSIPEVITRNQSFDERVKQQLKSVVDALHFSYNVPVIGLGQGYIGNSGNHKAFLSLLNGYIKAVSNKFTFASFVGNPGSELPDIDIVGVESYAEEMTAYETRLANWSSKNKPVIAGELVYPTFMGNKDGYLKDFSQEAQAKYVNDLIEYVEKHDLAGSILPVLYDYKSDVHSLFAGYSKDKELKIGLLGKDKNKSRLSYRVIKSKFANGEKVKIPVGTKANETPIYFILTGLFLSVLIALLVNSKRKFREDVTRALIRPYNFYADIRDQRILTGFHSNILMVTLAGSHSLLVTNILYYLRDNIVFERLLGSFGSEKLMNVVSYLAWNPVESLAYLFFTTIGLFILLAFIFKLASQFVRNRVLFVSIYYVVIWAFIPLSILLPVELILYKILIANVANVTVYVVLALFFVWMVQRLLKGIYVIFDVSGTKVYLNVILAVIIILGGIGLVLHFTEYTTYYFYNVLKQFTLI